MKKQTKKRSEYFSGQLNFGRFILILIRTVKVSFIPSMKFSSTSDSVSPLLTAAQGVTYANDRDTDKDKFPLKYDVIMTIYNKYIYTYHL